MKIEFLQGEFTYPGIKFEDYPKLCSSHAFMHLKIFKKKMFGYTYSK